MPCTAKKYEGQDLGDIDAVLTTREVDELLRRFGMKFTPKGPKAPLDVPFAEATGAGRIFGGTGGVMEAAMPACAMSMFPVGALTENLKLKNVRLKEIRKPGPVGHCDWVYEIAS